MRLGQEPFRTTFAARVLWLATGAAFGASAVVLARPAEAALDRTSEPCPRSDQFREVYRHVRNLALVEPDETRLYAGAVEGMLSSLDPYTQLISAEEWKQMNGQLRGEVVGVGLEFEERQGRLQTVAPIPGSPAAKASVRAGTPVLAVNGKPARSLTAQQLSLAMLGAAGTKVTLRFSERDGASWQDVVLVRTGVDAPDVESRLYGNDLAYARVALFQDGVTAQLRDQLAKLKATAGGSFKGLVIDLRHNPGGLLEEAVAMADLFVRDGPLVTAMERKGRHAQEMKASGKASETDYPVVLVVDDGTASAAEVFAAAMREHARALVVGGRTFGKGTVQDYVPLEDGSVLKITKAQYLTPTGHSLNGHGLEPDVAVVAKEGKDGRLDDVPLKVAGFAVRNWAKFAGRLEGPPVSASP